MYSAPTGVWEQYQQGLISGPEACLYVYPHMERRRRGVWGRGVWGSVPIPTQNLGEVRLW